MDQFRGIILEGHTVAVELEPLGEPAPPPRAAARPAKPRAKRPSRGSRP
jgi:hypothetical protein